MKKEIIAFFSIFCFIFIFGCTNNAEEDIEDILLKEGPYTLDSVAAHNTSEDCWMIIRNKVYDFTDFIAQHPGGQTIIQGCGTDATRLFETRPMGSGTPHSSRARALKDSYYIGELE